MNVTQIKAVSGDIQDFVVFLATATNLYETVQWSEHCLIGVSGLCRFEIGSGHFTSLLHLVFLRIPMGHMEDQLRHMLQ